MSKQLLESDFLTVDLRSMFNSQPENTEDNDNANVSSNDQQETDNTNKNSINQPKAANFDWGRELKKRLAANRNMSPESRRNDYDIETKFFSEFYKANWDTDCAKQLMLIGDPLRKTFKVLGFDVSINPIFRFLTLSYVKENLLKTKLLNINTFKAIYKAVADRWVADSEFFVANDYNIIYCRNLYKKPLSEIVSYLEQQKKVLKPNAKVYTREDQLENRKIFLKSSENSTTKIVSKGKGKQVGIANPKSALTVKDSKAVLNSLQAIQSMLGGLKPGNRRSRIANNDELIKLADKIKTPAEVYAVLQYLSMFTGSSKAKQALSSEKLKNVSTEDLTIATNSVSGIISKIRFTPSEVETFINELLDNL